MIRSFEELSIYAAGSPVGRFAGRVEFEFVEGDAHIKRIVIASEEAGLPDIEVTDAARTFTETFLFARLSPALLKRFAPDLMTTITHIRQREPRQFRAVS